MPYCSACGSKMEDNERFCASCGEQQRPEAVPAANHRAPASKPRWIYGLVGLVVIALIIGGLAIGWEDGIHGTWVEQDNPEHYLEIRKDGTFVLYKMGIRGGTGTWEINGDVIRFEIWGMTVEGRIEGDKIIDEYGTIFVRE
ncbi:zinc ribbon domain-containing protein [Dehalococcoidia bacterium]|nr:zinc ribbon domain-containing protein [Dehalococcoidia bacterium]